MSPVETAKQSPRIAEPQPQGKRIRVKQVDAFTDQPLTGNPAGVVLNAAGLTDEQMQRIAKEVAAPETAFILPAQKKECDLRIRWFTPETEVPLCGHATVGAFHALAEENMHGMKGAGSYSFMLETLSGPLPLAVEKRKAKTTIFLGLNVPVFVRAGQHKLDVMRLLGISLEEFENRMPIVSERYLYVPLRRLHTLLALKPNIFALSQFLTNRNFDGLCVFTLETVEKTSAVHSRFFAPNLGINEDPVTGSANGPLGVYLFQQGYLQQAGDTASIVGEQGDVLGRRGRVTIELASRDGAIHSVRIGGQAVTVLSGEMLIG